MNRIAFTLAEILITLTVIGIIAALTIPNLLTDMQEKKWDSARERAVYNIRQAAMLISNNKDGLNNIGTTNIEFTDELAKYLSVAKKCDIYKDCFHTKVKDLKGVPLDVPPKGISAPQIGYNSSDNAAGLILNNGTLMSIVYNPLCTENTKIFDAADSYGYNHVCANIVFDTNGKALPNQVGKDIGFAIVINPKNTVVEGVIPDIEDLPSSDWQTASSTCLAKGGTWHLPTKDELNSLAYNKFLSGNFTPSVLSWSSTEYDSTQVWVQGLSGAYQGHAPKTNSLPARCVKR